MKALDEEKVFNAHDEEKVINTLDENKLVSAIKLGILYYNTNQTDWDADGNLTYEYNGRNYMIQISALDMGPVQSD